MKELNWTVKKDGKIFGTLELSKPRLFSFDIMDEKSNDMSMMADIISLSGEIKNELEKIIEDGKEKASLKNKEWGRKHTEWSDVPVEITYLYLSVDFYAEKENKYEIAVCACDGIYGDNLCVEENIPVDVSEHLPEIKEILREQLMENFNQFF